jgi:hypothetical protein
MRCFACTRKYLNLQPLTGSSGEPGKRPGGQLSSARGSAAADSDTFPYAEAVVCEGLAYEEPADAAQNLGVHGGGDAAGLRVLLAGVVNAEEVRAVAGEFGFGAVREAMRGS